jgi:hypothetical protein
MDACTRRLALRSAAKVAFGSLFLHCGGALTQGPSDAQAEDAVAADAKTADAQAADAALACTGPTEVDAGDVTEEAFQCCVGDVTAAVGDASPFDPNGPDASAVANDPAAANCCRAIVARIDHEPDGGDPSADWTAASSVLVWCCDVAFEQGSACTPWGPPTPPAYLAPAEVA